MRTKKRGTGSTVPKKESTNYNKKSSISLFLSYIGIIGLVLSYQRVEWLFWLSVGIGFSGVMTIMKEETK